TGWLAPDLVPVTRARCHRTGEGCVLADMSSSLAYTRSGSGAPLVLLHGIGLNRSSWNPVVPRLAQHFDVIAVDLPGFGDSAEATFAEASSAQGHPRTLAEAVAG